MVETIEVQLPDGVVRGIRHGEGGVFRGMPYAAPPTGERRFLPPQPVVPWKGVRDAMDDGPTAPQRGLSPAVGHLVPNVFLPGDDYLHVNVATPDPGGSAPVVVFIHGGSFVTGSNALSLYGGGSFVRDGIVFVAINYRLGITGFLHLEDAVANRGLLDQIAALRWVRETISCFGGDPERVTVMGESAGAMSIGALLAMPQARGLFRRAILQSGADDNALSPKTARAVCEKAAQVLGVPPSAVGLRDVPSEAIVAAQEQVAAAIQRGPARRWAEISRHLLPFEPVIDGEILPEHPSAAVMRGDAAGVDVLVGYNAQEARLFFLSLPERGLKTRFAATLLGRRLGLSRRDIRAYRRENDEGTDLDLLTTIVTDGYYRAAAQRVAESEGDRYLYRFGWSSPAMAGKLGAAHTVELPFVFDALDDPDAQGVLQDARPQELAERMHRAWADFVRDGDPGWEPYRVSGCEHRFGLVDDDVHDPFATVRSRWCDG